MENAQYLENLLIKILLEMLANYVRGIKFKLNENYVTNQQLFKQ